MNTAQDDGQPPVIDRSFWRRASDKGVLAWIVIFLVVMLILFGLAGWSVAVAKAADVTEATKLLFAGALVEAFGGALAAMKAAQLIREVDESD